MICVCVMCMEHDCRERAYWAEEGARIERNDGITGMTKVKSVSMVKYGIYCVLFALPSTFLVCAMFAKNSGKIFFMGVLATGI